MTAAEMARIHAASFEVPRPWTAREVQEMLEKPATCLFTARSGFLIGRAASQEAELLTLAVDPRARRNGTGMHLVETFLDWAHGRAETAFLEVREDNLPAIALYQKMGFEGVGSRRGYYRLTDGSRVDALVMTRGLVA